MTIRRRTALASAIACACVPFAGPAQGQAYPSKTIKVVVPYPAGGPADAIARALAQSLADTTGQAAVVDNKPGASGTIGADIVAKSAPDGHTLLVINQLLVQSPSLYSKIPYDPLRDLIPVTDLISSPLWLAVNPAHMPARSFQEIVELAKARPRDYSYASVGNGSIGHLYGVRLNEAAGLNLMHVPYKGAAPVVLALLAGEVAVALVDFATLKPHLAAGKLRALAVSAVKRSSFTPEVPTFGELGLSGFESSSWIALFVAAKTPPEIVQRLHAEASRLLRQPDISAKFLDQGFDLGPTPSAQFALQVTEDFSRWGRLIRKAGIKLD